jgi:hypothetical protein
MATDRRATLRAVLSFLSLEPLEPELRLLHQYADTWRGIGDVVAGMARQDYDLELPRYKGHSWRAMFFLSGLITRSLRMPAARGRRALGRQRSERPATRSTDENTERLHSAIG